MMTTPTITSSTTATANMPPTTGPVMSNEHTEQEGCSDSETIEHYLIDRHCLGGVCGIYKPKGTVVES